MSANLPMVALVGQPNVGKSSLFNRLSQDRLAIVARESGTTRDAIQRLVEIEDKSFWLVDTAGLYGETMKNAGDIEQSMQAQVLEAITEATLIVAVFDATRSISVVDRRLLKQLHKSDKPLVVVINKIDKTRQTIPDEFKKLGNIKLVGTSTTTGLGTAELRKSISQLLPAIGTVKSRPPARASIVGRPNVGKSSLFNKLAGSTRAIVSDIAHTTRDANLARLSGDGHELDLFDTAGIRRPSKRREIELFSYMRTIRTINQSDVSILVIDSTEPSVRTDQTIAGLAKDSGKGLIITINKWDLIEDKETTRLAIEQRLQTDFAFAWWAPVIFISAKSGHNVNKLRELIDMIITTRKERHVSTDLTRIISEAVAQHKPGLGRKGRPVIDKVTQTGVSPPEFTFKGRQLAALHWSYKRYLEAQLRQHLNLAGTAISMRFE